MNKVSDFRWHIFRETWRCADCGEQHQGVKDLATSKPDYWLGENAPSPNSMVSTSTHFLSEDFCVVNDEHYFVRCVLEIPLVGAGGDKFGNGVWSSLSKSNFGNYVARFDSGDQLDQGPWFGWFANTLKGYPETRSLKCHVHPQSQGQRPLIELEPTEHPLAIEQRDGITFERLMAIYDLHGHKHSPAIPTA